jgi:competence protein ComEA
LTLHAARFPTRGNGSQRPLKLAQRLTPKDAHMFKRILVAFLAFFAFSVFAADANTATQADLEAIKGIGPAIATKIIDERKNGNYKDWPDLVARVKGIGDKNAAKLSGAGLTVNGAAMSGAPAAPAAPAKTTAPATATVKPVTPATPATPAVAAKTAAPAAPAAPASTAKELKQAEADAKKAAKAQKKADKAAAAASAASAAKKQ